jgi:cytoskeletal protein RodZ
LFSIFIFGGGAMSIKVRSSLHSLVIIAVLFFSAIGPTIVYADGGTTGDTPPTETTTECASDGTTNECSSEAATVEAPAAPAAEGSGSAGNDLNAAPAEQATTLNDVPENTTVAVVDAQGQAEPLATQAAAEALATTSDPFWCPGTQTTPTPGVNNCTTSFGSFNALLTFLAANPTSYQGAGTIYVQQGAYSGGESSINFNNYNLSSISNAG